MVGLGFMVSVKGLGCMVFCEGFVVFKDIEAKKYQDIYFGGLTIDQSSKINVLIFLLLRIKVLALNYQCQDAVIKISGPCLLFMLSVFQLRFFLKAKKIRTFFPSTDQRPVLRNNVLAFLGAALRRS